jgi:hypothetical protein
MNIHDLAASFPDSRRAAENTRHISHLLLGHVAHVRRYECARQKGKMKDRRRHSKCDKEDGAAQAFVLLSALIVTLSFGRVVEEAAVG